jgi:glycosyltransferase involved in cell wall biosynthesis
MQVSVLIPAYNAERYLAETLRSALAQSHTDLDVIVIDDGSTDRTAEIAGATGDPRVRVLSFPNGGIAYALNRGLAHARGPVIALLGADDLWYPPKVETQLPILSDSRVALIGSRMRYVSESGRMFGICGEPTEGRQHDIRACRFIPFPLSSALFRTADARALGGFDESLKQAEDLDFLSRLATRGEIRTVSDALGAYRVHFHSLTAAGHDEQQLNSKYLQARANARENGQPEPSYKEFRNNYRPTAWERRAAAGARWFRSAGVAAMNGQPFSAGRYLVGAAAASPIYTARRAIMRLH